MNLKMRKKINQTTSSRQFKLERHGSFRHRKSKGKIECHFISGVNKQHKDLNNYEITIEFRNFDDLIIDRGIKIRNQNL